MNIAILQLNPHWEKKEQNKKKVHGLLDRLAPGNIDLLVLPEMTLTGFTMRSRSFAEPADGPTCHFFCDLAEIHDMHIMYGYIEHASHAYYNTLVHVNPGGQIVSQYRKIHPFSFTGEERFYTAGNQPVITEVKGYKFGLSICYDLRFPELFRFYGKQKVDAIINVANWPVQRISHFTSLLEARAIENLCYVIAANRSGRDKSNEYNGSSAVYSPVGAKVAELSRDEVIETITVDFEEVEQTRLKFPFLEDIRLI